MPLWFPIVMGAMSVGCFAAARWCYGKGALLKREAAAALSWPSVPATITRSYIGTITRHGGPEMGTIDIPVACVSYAYEIEGKHYESNRIGTGGHLEGKKAKLDEFVAAHPVGNSVPAYFDPAEPAKSVLVRGSAGGDAGQYTIAAVALAIVGIAIIIAILYTALAG